MIGKIAVVFSSIVLAIAILTISVFRCAGTRYAFTSSSPTPKPETIENKVEINYQLIYPGKILPDNPVWYAKVLRDKLQYLLTFNSTKKAELNLLYADKRLASSQILFEKGKVDLGYSTLTKSAKYLEKVFLNNPQDVQFLLKLANASLKHREVIEEVIVPLSPEDLKPEIIKTKNVTIISYNKTSDILKSKGEQPPTNPFESE